jgi:hypothetical protein
MAAASSAKVNKPSEFTGKDLSLATVNSWVYRVEDYVEDVATDAKKVKIAGSLLTETAEMWYNASIRNANPLPTFAEFVIAFRSRFSRSDEPHILRAQLKAVRQGDRNVLDYHAEFATIMAQIGPELDVTGTKGLFVRHSIREVQERIAHTIRPTDTLDDIVISAQRAYEVYLRFKPKAAQAQGRAQVAPASPPPR